LKFDIYTLSFNGLDDRSAVPAAIAIALGKDLFSNSNYARKSLFLETNQRGVFSEGHIERDQTSCFLSAPFSFREKGQAKKAKQNKKNVERSRQSALWIPPGATTIFPAIGSIRYGTLNPVERPPSTGREKQKSKKQTKPGPQEAPTLLAYRLHRD
jgi:hypothetical protein